MDLVEVVTPIPLPLTIFKGILWYIQTLFIRRNFSHSQEDSHQWMLMDSDGQWAVISGRGWTIMDSLTQT